MISKILLNGLQEYQASLNRHISQVREDLKQLKKKWDTFETYLKVTILISSVATG